MSARSVALEAAARYAPGQRRALGRGMVAFGGYVEDGAMSCSTLARRLDHRP